MANEVRILVTADDRASGPIGNVRQNVATMAAGFATGLLATEAFTGAMSALGGVVSSSVGAFLESEQVTAKLNAVLKSTGGAAGVTASQVEALSASLQSATGIGDEAITSAQTMLLTFTKIGSEVFPQATEATLNMAQAFGMDASNAAITLGKALNDPIGGVTALRRIGVQLTEDQEKQIRKFVELGDTMSAQKIILGELETEIGGVARAMGDTAQGQLNRFREGVDNLQETIGGAIVKGFTPLLEKVADFAESDEAAQMADDLASALGGLARFTVGAADAVAELNRQLSIFGGLSGTLDKLMPFFGIAAEGPQNTRSVGGFLKGLFDIEGNLGIDYQRRLAGSAPITSDSIEAGDFSRNVGFSDPFQQLLTDINASAMGNAAAMVPKLTDKQYEENARKAEEVLQRLGMDAMPNLEAATRAATGSAQALTEAQREQDRQAQGLTRALQDIHQQQVNEQIEAYEEGGKAQLELVKAQQTSIMDAVRTKAAELQEIWGLEFPDALTRAFDIVKGGIDSITESAKKLHDFGLNILQQNAQRNVRYAPGVLETIAGATGLNTTFAPPASNFGSLETLAAMTGLPSFAGGGYMASDGLALLHSGERVLTPEQQRAGGGITVNISGPVYGVDDLGDRVIAAINRAIRRDGAVLLPGAVMS